MSFCSDVELVTRDWNSKESSKLLLHVTLQRSTANALQAFLISFSARAQAWASMVVNQRAKAAFSRTTLDSIAVQRILAGPRAKSRKTIYGQVKLQKIVTIAKAKPVLEKMMCVPIDL